MEITLKKEGITPEFIKSINMDKEYSPVQLMPNEEPVNLIKFSTGYWVSLGFGEYLKDEKNKLIVISEKDAKIGRARYVLNFKDKIEADTTLRYECQIQSEISRLKIKVDERVKDDLSKMRQILVMGGKIEVHGIEAILTSAIESASGNDPYSLNYGDKFRYEQQKLKAKELATDDLLQAYDCLKKLSDNGEYDTLYQHYFQDGLPLLASFNHGNVADMEALKKNFHRDKIMATIDQIKSKDHLYMVAKFNIDKII